MLAHVGGLVGTSRIPSRAYPIYPAKGLNLIITTIQAFAQSL